MDPSQAKGWIEVLFLVGGAVSGALTTWALLRRDVAELKRDVEGGPDDWSVPEMRRRLRAAWDAIDQAKKDVEALRLADSRTEGELKALETRVAEHAARTIKNGQEGYRALFDETLKRMEQIIGGKA